MNLITCCVMVAASLLNQTGGNTRVAVVSIPVVSEKYNKTADLEAYFDGIRGQLSQQRDALRNKIDRLSRSLQEELRPGTAEYAAREKELAMAQAELQWFMDSESKRVERGLSNSMREIFDDIQRVVRNVAESRGYDIVLASDKLPDEPAESATQIRQQILLQKVLYWKPQVDITDEVVSKLNADYEARKSKESQPEALQTPPK